MAAMSTLQQLIADGVLPIGSEIFHPSRTHKERAVVGHIRAGGIEFNGKVYSSPSGAARAVSGTTAENGWVFWRVRSTGGTLSKLRSSG